MKAQFLGLRYIGLPTAAIIAQKDIHVHGVDVNQDLVHTINRGELHIIELGLEKVVKEGVEKGIFKASLAPKHAKIQVEEDNLYFPS